MIFLASRRWRIFLIAWLVYSVHFATNVVREHYPAFSLIEQGTFRVDDYRGFHADIFVHHDGHAVIGNQVLVSTLAAVPLLLFKPGLDALERYGKAKVARDGVSNAEYRVDKPMRQDFFRLVKERGLELRLGAATFITTAFFMAPLTAGFLVLFYGVLRTRGVNERDAVGLTLLFGFGTPLLFRATVLGQNMFVMFFMFMAFVQLWAGFASRGSPTFGDRLRAGLFGGATLASDYIGVMILPLLWGYFVCVRQASSNWRTSLRESIAMVVGSLPPLVFLLYSQWAMYGHPFYPGQYWMPEQNVYVNQGLRGFTWPDMGLLWDNLFDPAFGMFAWAPVLAIAMIPAVWYDQQTLVLPRRERWFTIAAVVALLAFCSANQYARLQFNSGFRYLLPLVPLLFLGLADHWIRLPSWMKLLIAALAGIHAWVLAVFREPVGRSWQLFLDEGIQLPWFRVLRMTSSPDNSWLNSSLVPTGVFAGTLVVVAVIWRYGARLERQRAEA